ncbi:MAG TPA: hypothetical protein VKV05_03390 [Terriglobales bacterium]|nr:hypothetical protein [Terriglobales bacterium]
MGARQILAQRPGVKEKYLLMALVISFVLGMAVAIGVYWVWRSGGIAPGFHDVSGALALLLCPPYILSLAIGPSPDSYLELGLAVGTIVFANGFLYAGVAAVGYFFVALLVKRLRRS